MQLLNMMIKVKNFEIIYMNSYMQWQGLKFFCLKKIKGLQIFYPNAFTHKGSSTVLHGLTNIGK